MTLSAAEQYLLELINRARLDPAGEAARLGIDLNKDLAAGQISTAAKQVLAPNALLEAAATKHTQWMIATDTFSHTGLGGSSPGARITAEGYSWNTYGENIALQWSSGTLTVEGSIAALHEGLFLSAGHRVNLMNGSFREVGLGAEAGLYSTGGRTYNSVFLTEVFATGGSARFLTGVAYDDANGNRFYSMGEGRADVSFAAEMKTTVTAAAGGYAVALGGAAQTAVSGHVAGQGFSLTVDMSQGNVKLDVVSGTTFHTSGTVWLGSGIHDLVQLGVGHLSAWGNARGNALTGNSGDNRLYGNGGSDTLAGGLGGDRLFGGAGGDVLAGGQGDDLLRGGGGADRFDFGPGQGLDRVADFGLADQDRLRLDDALWAGQGLTAAEVVSQFARLAGGNVVFDFGVEEVRLLGLTSLAGLEAAIEIV